MFSRRHKRVGDFCRLRELECLKQTFGDNSDISWIQLRQLTDQADDMDPSRSFRGRVGNNYLSSRE